MRQSLLLAWLALLSGCGLTLDAVIDEDASAPEAGRVDASLADAGAMDAGMADGGPVPVDGGRDASRPMDANVADAVVPVDAGSDAAVPADAVVPVDAVAPVDTGTLDAMMLDAGCFDRDDDGVTNCAGDCDDMDPLAFPGSLEVCDDGRDNDCDLSTDESGCIGTYVSEEGSDSAPGSIAEPLATVAQALIHARMIGPGTPIRVSEGDYSESLSIEDDHSVLCGWDVGFTDQNRGAHPTFFTAGPGGHRFRATAQPGTRLERCMLEGPDEDSLSITVVFERGAAGTLENNLILAGDALGGASIAVGVHPEGAGTSTFNAGVRPVIMGNDIELGDSRVADPSLVTAAGSYGVVVVASDASVRGNDILMEPDEARRIAGIVFVDTPNTAEAHNNLIRGMRDAAGSAGINVRSGSASITRNEIYPPDGELDSVGILLTGDLGTLQIANNVSYGGASSSGVSGGLLFRPRALAGGAVLVHSNFLSGGSNGEPAFGIGWEAPLSVGIAVPLGVVRNNILVAGEASQSHAAWESNMALQPAGFDHNALSADGLVLYLRGGGVGWAVATDVNSPPTHFSNITDECSLLAPVPEGDHHLTAASLACIDTGDGTNGPERDFDGDLRPAAPLFDIGPDERIP